jgi:hypothetical protein
MEYLRVVRQAPSLMHMHLPVEVECAVPNFFETLVAIVRIGAVEARCAPEKGVGCFLAEQVEIAPPAASAVCAALNHTGGLSRDLVHEVLNSVCNSVVG